MTLVSPDRPLEAWPPPVPPALPAPPVEAPPPGKWRYVNIARLAFAAAIVGAGVAMELASVLIVPVLFILVVPFEKLFPRHRQKVVRPGVLTDIGYALAQPVLAAVGIAVGSVVGIASLAWLPGLGVRPLVEMMPSGARIVAGIALFDLVTYWVHRWSHEVAFLWRFHSIHHSTTQLDWISGFRNHPVDGALLAPPFVFLLAAGFDPTFAGALAIVQVVTGLFVHANVRWQWRPLQRVVITPEFHHWHHADERDAHNSNYSVFLPLWDLAFGTYYMPKGRRPMRYGAGADIPSGMAGQLRYPLAGLHGPIWIVRHPVLEVRHLARAIRRGGDQLVASTRRPTRRTRRSRDT